MEKGQVIPVKELTAKTATPIYVRNVQGRWSQLRQRLGGFLVVLFILLPWFSWHGRQAIWVDIPSQKIHLFSLVLWPQDLIIMALLFMLAAMGLFWLTTWLGRVWCGYACPQTIWTYLFIWCEERFEGSRNQRITLDKGPWTWNKLRRKGLKHSAWLVISFITALTFLSYFNPVALLYRHVLSGQASVTVYGFTLFFMVATYLNAGWLRETMCMHMCPYARIQAVMFDNKSYLVDYDAARGEERGPRRRQQNPASLGLGDCVDCNLCVQVCPAGIDIRQGLQYECINCGACIDACDQVMVSMGYRQGLIRYISEHQKKGRSIQIRRPKLWAYGGACIGLIVAIFALMVNLKPMAFDVLRDRNVLYRMNDQGWTENTYTLKVMNKSEETQLVQLSLRDLPEHRWQGTQQISLTAGESQLVPITIAAKVTGDSLAIKPITFIAKQQLNGIEIEQKSRFFSQ